MRAIEIPAADFPDEVVVAAVFEFAFEVFYGFLDGRDDVVVIELVAPSGEDYALGGAWDVEGEGVRVFRTGADTGAVPTELLSAVRACRWFVTL